MRKESSKLVTKGTGTTDRQSHGVGLERKGISVVSS